MNAQRIKGPPQKSFRHLLFVFLPPLVHGCPGTSQHRSRIPFLIDLLHVDSHEITYPLEIKKPLRSHNLWPVNPLHHGGIFHCEHWITLDNTGGCLRYLNNTGRKRNWRTPNPRHGPIRPSWWSHHPAVLAMSFATGQNLPVAKIPNLLCYHSTRKWQVKTWESDCWVEVTSTHRCRFSWLVPCHSDRQQHHGCELKFGFYTNFLVSACLQAPAACPFVSTKPGSHWFPSKLLADRCHPFDATRWRRPFRQNHWIEI